MRIGVISDTHCKDEKCNLELLENYFNDIGIVIHAGDVGHISCLKYLSKFGEVTAVAGNNDLHLDYLEDVQELKIRSKKISVIHGHQFAPWAIEKEVVKKFGSSDIIIFGHTHVPLIEKVNGKILINPGSYNRPRTKNRKKTFMILEISREISIDLIEL